MGKLILTNKFNLPETLVAAVAHDEHKNHGTISCTTLIDAPQIRKLKEANDYEMDVVDGIYALLGTALHNVLERSSVDEMRKRAFIVTAETLMLKAKEFEGTAPEQANNLRGVGDYLFQLIPHLFPEIGARYIFEITQTLDYSSTHNHVISGTLDLYDQIDHVLWDYKLCGTYMFMNPEARKKWDEQTNIYAYMLIQNGKPVKEIKIVAFFRDWNEYGKMQKKNYPERQIMEIPIALRPIDKIEARIKYHLSRHMVADAGQNVECTGEERWATADEFAIFPAGAKRAAKICDTRPQAEHWIKENGHTKKQPIDIVVRPGESRRCEGYCQVSKFCPQYARELQERQKALAEV